MVGVGSGMCDQIIGWDEEVPEHEDQIMTFVHVSSLRYNRASYGTAVFVADVRPSDYVSGVEEPAVDGGVPLGWRIGVTRGWDAVYRFG